MGGFMRDLADKPGAKRKASKREEKKAAQASGLFNALY
jgi:hypothetical protein